MFLRKVFASTIPADFANAYQTAELMLLDRLYLINDPNTGLYEISYEIEYVTPMVVRIKVIETKPVPRASVFGSVRDLRVLPIAAQSPFQSNLNLDYTTVTLSQSFWQYTPKPNGLILARFRCKWINLKDVLRIDQPICNPYNFFPIEPTLETLQNLLRDCYAFQIIEYEKFYLVHFPPTTVPNNAVHLDAGGLKHFFVTRDKKKHILKTSFLHNSEHNFLFNYLSLSKDPMSQRTLNNLFFPEFIEGNFETLQYWRTSTGYSMKAADFSEDEDSGTTDDDSDSYDEYDS